MNRTALLSALRARPLVLDAAMGTRLIARGLDLTRDDPALWNLDRPETVLAIHQRDAAAGAEVLITNSFGANRARLGRLGREPDVEHVNQAAARLAREAAGSTRWVLGDIGPHEQPTRESFREQATALVAAQVDGLLLETMTQADVTQVVEWICPSVDVPMFLSLRSPTLSHSGRGDAPDYRKLGLSGVGSNCGSLARTVVEIARLSRITDLPLLAKPACGIPGKPSLSPQELASAVPGLLDLGVALIGGCCGATDAHVAALRDAVDLWIKARVLEIEHNTQSRRSTQREL